MIKEIIGTIVFTGEYQGHEIIIRKMVWNKKLKEIVPNVAQDYYCGYVEVLPKDYYFNHLAQALCELNVFGGITYTSQDLELPCLPAGKKFVGFDTAHAYQPKYSLETVKRDCISLINQIVKANG